MNAGLLGHELACEPRRKPGGRDFAAGNRTDPESIGIFHGLNSDHLASQVAVVEEFDGKLRLQQRLKAAVTATRRIGERVCADRRDKAFPRRDAIMRIELRRTAAHDLRDFGIRPNDGNALAGF